MKVIHSGKLQFPLSHGENNSLPRSRFLVERCVTAQKKAARETRLIMARKVHDEALSGALYDFFKYCSFLCYQLVNFFSSFVNVNKNY